MSEDIRTPKLSGLSLNPGEIAFDPDITEYSVTVEAGTTKILVTPTLENTSDFYTVTGNANLTDGENEIVITVTGSDATNYYRVHVTVGETATEAATVEAATTASTTASFQEYATGSSMRNVTAGIMICIIAAAAAWAIYVVHRTMERKALEEEKLRRRQEREAARARQRLAQQQEEELLRQIEILTAKSHLAAKKGETTRTGARLIELDDNDRASLAKARANARRLEEEAEERTRSAAIDDDITLDLDLDFDDDDDDDYDTVNRTAMTGRTSTGAPEDTQVFPDPDASDND